MTYLLDFRARNIGGAVVPGVIVRAPGLGSETDLRGETEIVFLVHGFNVTRAAGREALLRLAGCLAPGTTAAHVAVLWPGDHWARAASYSFEGRDADDSARALVRYIGDVIARGSELSFVSHSLGGRVVMETVKGLATTGYRIRQVCLLAAAIDDSSLADPRYYLNATQQAQRVAVLASRKDRVLQLAYPGGDLLQWTIFFKTDAVGLALGYHGPRKSPRSGIPGKVLHEQIPDHRRSGHGDYLPGDMPNVNQASAVTFSAEVLRGAPQPHYPDPPPEDTGND